MKNKQFTDNMKKGTLIALSMGIGAGAVVPGMIPMQDSQVMKVQASEVPPALGIPENASFFTDFGDVSNYKFMTSSSYVDYVKDGKRVSTYLNDSVKDIEEFDGVLYGTTSNQYNGKIVRFNETANVWEEVGSVDAPIFDIVKTSKDVFATGGGKTGTLGTDYDIFSSVGSDDSWKSALSMYNSFNYPTLGHGAGIFKAAVAVDDKAMMFGESGYWTNVRTSVDGKNFASNGQFYGTTEEAIYAGGKIIAVGSQYSQSTYGSIASGTPEGKFTVTKLGYNEKFRGVTYGNGTYVAVGNYNSWTPIIYTSTDGVNWKKKTVPTGAQALFAVEYDENNQRFVAVGKSGTMLMSLDGEQWVKVNSGLTSDLTDLEITEVKTATLSATPNAGNIELKYSSLVEGASSYELKRNGEVVYTGTDLSFVDTETRGNQGYSYVLNIKNADGEIIGSKTQTVKTADYTAITTENKSGSVAINVDYVKDEAVTYEVLRNGVKVYEGTNSAFVDKTTLGATNYTYQVNVKNPEGAVIDSKTAEIQTPIGSLSNLQTETTSPTGMHVSWDDVKNPENTEYLVQASPVTPVDMGVVTVEEGFESASPVLPRTGTWEPSTISAKSGTKALKSAVIGHSKNSVTTYEIDVPVDVTDAKVSFDYRVSSEANYDKFTAVLNGTTLFTASGEKTWVNIEKALKPGKNTLTFMYKKDGSGTKGSDAGFVDNLHVPYKDSGERTSGWITEKEYDFTDLAPDAEYKVSVVAKANGLETTPLENGANQELIALQEVTDALESLTQTIDLTSLDNINNAQAQLDALKEMANALTDSETKTNLMAELNDLQQLVTDAKNLAEVTGEVDEFVESLPAELLTAEAIQEARDALTVVQERVNSIADSEAKTELKSQLDAVEKTINLAEQVMVATESVLALNEKLESLETREAIASARDTLVEAGDLVEALPTGETKTGLSGELTKAKEVIQLAENVLQAKEAVKALGTALETLETQEAINFAHDELEKTNSLVSVLPAENADRLALEKVMADALKTIEKAQDAFDVKQAELAVADVVASPSQTGVDNALVLVTELKDSQAKTAMLETIETVQQAIYLETASKLVEKALDSLTQEDVTSAKEALELVKDVKSKAEMVKDIELAQEVVDAMPVQEQLRAFEENLDKINKRPKKDEATALEAEYKSILNGISALDDSPVEKQLQSELAEIKGTLDAVLKNGNHPNKAPGQVKKDTTGFISKVKAFFFGN